MVKIDKKYQMFVEFGIDAFFQGDHDGNLIFVNEKACLLTGYSRAELLKKNISELFSKQILTEKPLNYERLKKGETLKTEREIITRDGVSITVEMNSNRLPDGSYQAFFRDITERKIAEAALVASERKYRKLHNSMMDGYVFVRMNGTIVDSNVEFQKMVGFTPAELIMLSYVDLTPLKWHSMEEQIVKDQILPHGHSEVYQKEYKKKDGTIFPVELRTFLVHNEDCEPEGMWAIVRDITRRHETEETIRESEEKFRSIVESSPTSMYFYRLEPDGRLVLTGANPAAERTIGIAHKLLIGKTIEEAFPNLASTDIPAMYKKVASGELSDQTFEIQYSDERFSGYYEVYVFKTGNAAIAVDFVDITGRKHAEEMNQRSAEQKSILLREIHHRVKNNLAIVISLLNFQLRRNEDPELSRMIRDIQLRIRSMALIHEHLYSSENLDRIPLATYIQSLSSIIMSAFSGHRITLKTNLCALDVGIETALPIGLIINELLTNAFKYAFPGNQNGTISLELEANKEDWCTLVVKDDGIGIPEDITIESEKSLGMYIVGLLAEQLDGGVEIVRNEGTTFIIRFKNLIRT